MLFGGPKVDFVVFVFGSKHDLWRWVDWLVLFFWLVCWKVWCRWMVW